MIAVPEGRDQRLSPEGRAHDPVVQRYHAFFALLDWDQAPDRDSARPWPGPPPHPTAAYIKALLVKLCEHKTYITHLRAFLVEHPWLVLELGFRPVLAPGQPYGFDVERTVPCDRYLRHWQQTLAPPILQALLRATVCALQAEIPGLGTTVAVDVKHIYAWAQANNPKAFVTDRFNPARQPRGDPDCRLGVKRRSNQERVDGPPTERAEYVWGYGTGVVAATDPRHGDVVLAEHTLPFNEHDSTDYHPLYRQTVATLGVRPTNVTADAAFDAWHIYQTCADTGGLAAIPLNPRGRPPPARDERGHPRCPEGLSMTPSYQFDHTSGYRAQVFRCPLLVPAVTGETCAHEQFVKGPGCVKYLNIEAGGRMRVEPDRQAETYKAIYRQRTAAERINSQATALGIERPRVRRQRSARTLNSLTYLVINARALQRVRSLNAHAPPPPSLC
jgi:Transposase DDE domain